MANKNDLKNKKVLIIGFGLHGGGRSVFVYLQQHGANIRITDAKTKTQLHSTLKGLKGVRGTFGSYSKKDVVWADFCVKNPGVPQKHPLLLFAKKIKKPVTTDLELFQKDLGRAFDCVVTGTRGKTTTATLVGHFMRATNSPVLVLGNNRIPALSLVKKAKKARVILEASSFQIEDSKLAARVSVFTTFYQDHLNRYSSLQKYFNAKAKLFLTQSKKDTVVLNYDDAKIRKLAQQIKGRKLYFSFFVLPIHLNGVYITRDKIFLQSKGKRTVLFDKSAVGLSGNHNIQNVLAASAAAIALRVPRMQIRKQVKSFRGVPYRLERIRIYKKRIFYNDTTATSPEAFFVAYTSLREKYPLSTLRFIVGGADKKLDFSILKKIKKDPFVFLYPLTGSATPNMLRNSALDVKGMPKRSLKEAFQNCWHDSSPGDVIALSPGAASFGMFQHEFDRGEQFTKLVKQLS